ncbi:MAG: aryl-sulfate sulfotransferase [Candidatus Hodarchaeota archaeon]
MRKCNKTLVLCVLTLVLILNPNQATLSAAQSMFCLPKYELESFELEYFNSPRPEIVAAMEFTGTNDSCPGALGVFSVDYVTNVTIGNKTEEITTSYVLFVNNQGQIVRDIFYEGFRGFIDPQMLNETTYMVSKTPMGYLTFWNLETNVQYTIVAVNVTQVGHHDWCYNPVTDTFMALFRENVEAENATWEVDMILEFDWAGNILWEFHMSESDRANDYYGTKCMISDHFLERQLGVLDWSHSNTIYWDSNTNIIYINPRNLDNVWAIEYPTGKVLWIAGRNGDFTMYDLHGNEKISLWWHSHSFYPIPGEPNKFILFDNDLHNVTSGSQIFVGPTGVSRIVEVEIDPDTWIMRETWSWAAPPDYYSPVWSYAQRLPNGNRVGCFGSRGLPENAKYGGTLVEVKKAGEIVWQVTFPKEWRIYRGRRFVPSLSLNSPADLTCDQGVNDCPGIIWTGKSVFKDYYQITKAGELLVKDTWTTAKIAYELPSDLAVGTHEYTLTVVDLAGQSVSDTVKVTVEAPMPVFEILPTVEVPIVLSIGLTMVGLTVVLRRKWPWAS